MKRARLACLGLVLMALISNAAPVSPPNVVLIMTDDQGHGDLGFHGNPIIRTPNLDQLAQQSVRFEQFYVSPVCSPTRASLMTGRYNYRTGVVDTYLGRSLMEPNEVTIAEMLAGAGYRTAIFGKWHLGDNYPLRPQDQGFQESLVLKGGGIGQPSDPPGGTSYFNPVLQHNGQPKKILGYCSDIFTDAAIDFIRSNRERKFFVYLAFNCPHTPLEVPDSYLRIYQNLDFSAEVFPAKGRPLPDRIDPASTARIYAMVTNIDDNVGRLLKLLDQLDLSKNTIVIFLTDNGPQQVRYNSGMLGRKGSVHEGGIRVPFFIRWPEKLAAGKSIDRLAAHIDLAPTLLEACCAPKPKRVQFDGRSLMPLLLGPANDWPDRTLFFQWHRGDQPERFRAFAARTQQFKLVQANGANEPPKAEPLRFQLFDMVNDPLEFHDLAHQHPETVRKMQREYEAWLADVSRTRGFDPPRIHVGTPQENPTVLTRQDWRGPRAGWGAWNIGYWEIFVTQPGAYEIGLQFPKNHRVTAAHLSLGKIQLNQPVEPGAEAVTFRHLTIPKGPARLEPWLESDRQRFGPQQVVLRRLDRAGGQ